jgi:hypothetical protein
MTTTSVAGRNCAPAPRRDTPVTCDHCGRVVRRRSRQQRFCSDACRERGRERSRKAFLSQDTGAPTHPLKKVNGISVFGGRKSWSSTPPELLRKIVEVEVFAGRQWRPVISTDGVACEVAACRTRALLDRGSP